MQFLSVNTNILKFNYKSIENVVNICLWQCIYECADIKIAIQTDLMSTCMA